MALVNYSSDEDEQRATETVPLKSLSRKRKASESAGGDLPALPDTFHDLYATAVRTAAGDDPSLHEGRRRAIPHTEGVWPSHVYIEWRPDSNATEVLHTILTHLKKGNHSDTVNSLLTTNLGADVPLHISLSRTLSLPTDKRESFLARLDEVIGKHRIRAFETRPQALIWVPNHEGTRWFLVLQLEPPQDDQLNISLRACNEVCEEFNQPILYEDDVQAPSSIGKKAKVSANRKLQASAPGTEKHNPFHISIAWTLLEPDGALQKLTDNSWTSTAGAMSVSVDRLKVKVGNAIYSISLLAGRAKPPTFVGSRAD